MAEEVEGQDTGAEASGSEVTDTDRVLTIGFVAAVVVIVVLGLVALSWHYRPHSADVLCADPEAHCSDNRL